MFTLSRIIAMIGLAEAQDFKRKAVRAIILSVLLLILSLFALGFALAAVAVWLFKFMAAWQALLLVAGILIAIAVIVALILSGRSRRRSAGPARLSQDARAAAENAEAAVKSVNPLVIIGFAVVAGIVLGRRAIK